MAKSSEDFSPLTTLTTLDLSRNSIQVTTICNCPGHHLQNCQNHLNHFVCYFFSQNGKKLLSKVLHTFVFVGLPLLTHLNLSHNQVGGIIMLIKLLVLVFEFKILKT